MHLSRNRLFVTVAGLVTVLLGGCREAAPEGTAALPSAVPASANPAQNYARRCAGCHEAGVSGAPLRSALAAQSPAAILAALETGVMQQQAHGLSAADRAGLARYLGAADTAAAASVLCRGGLELAGAPSWNRWGNGIDNRRYQSAARGGLTP